MKEICKKTSQLNALIPKVDASKLNHLTWSEFGWLMRWNRCNLNDILQNLYQKIFDTQFTYYIIFNFSIFSIHQPLFVELSLYKKITQNSTHHHFLMMNLITF
jgi:hypothetical protein